MLKLFGKFGENLKLIMEMLILMLKWKKLEKKVKAKFSMNITILNNNNDYH